ncbi:glycosyltransferase [Ancylobacter sp.]|uniref:glycosyltransferase n=1 Tax=Ancylobacter sp. TaxID=1872567 RepID=UPI003D0FD0EB
MFDPVALTGRVGRGLARRLRRLLPSPNASPFEGERLPELRGKPIPFGPVRLLSANPPIFLSGMPYDEFLGIAPSFAARYGDAKAGFIVYPTWSVESVEKAKYIAYSVARHVRQYSNHRFTYICNTQGEADLLNRFGQKALFLNHKFTVSEDIFRPLEGANAEFDAIYNARFVAGKRHELAAEIDRVAYVTYAEPQESRQIEFRTLWNDTLERNPRHALLNKLERGLPVALTHAEVNEAQNRASVGLILSQIEGASYATVEYMLAGLPVVSTRSIGGRDVFFDDAYCAVVDADPRAVRDAVAALKARNIPREFIRAQTLKRIEPDRRRFLNLVDTLLEDLDESPRFQGVAWPFSSQSGVPWDGFKHHLAAFERARSDGGNEGL